MATYTVASGAVAKNALTLVASQVDTITWTDSVDTVEIVNTSTTDTVYYTNDGGTPTVGGANSYPVPPSMVDRRALRSTKSVKVISSGTPTIHVLGA